MRYRGGERLRVFSQCMEKESERKREREGLTHTGSWIAWTQSTWRNTIAVCYVSSHVSRTDIRIARDSEPGLCTLFCQLSSTASWLISVCACVKMLIYVPACATHSCVVAYTVFMCMCLSSLVKKEEIQMVRWVTHTTSSLTLNSCPKELTSDYSHSHA